MKLYLLIADAFYDWSVAGVFSTEEKALAAREKHPYKEHYTVEEYILDEE